MNHNNLNLPLIIETSLAPSPMARVTAFLFFLINSTTNAFCKGVTLQHITARQKATTSKNTLSICGCRQCTSECPLITMAKLVDASSGLSSGEPPWYSSSVLKLWKKGYFYDIGGRKTGHALKMLEDVK